MSSRLITVFLKWPEPGRVKTRLAARLGEVEAAEAYRRLVETVGRLLRDRHGADLCVYFAPASREAALRAWLEPEVFPAAKGVFWRPQPEGDLGFRQAEAVRQAFALGYDTVALVGTDCVALRPRHFDEAWEALRRGASWVVGPATDGGYWLVATREPDTAFFENVRWSSPFTLVDCLANISEGELSRLEVLDDIDDYDDWLSVRDQLDVLHGPP